MRQFLLRLYPAAWRKRYGDEFEALLEERPLTPFDVADVLLGAVDAHLHRRGRAASQNRKGLTMSRQLGGNAAVIAGCLWLVCLPLSNLSGGLTSIVALAGCAALLVAVAGLSSSEARQHPILAWATFVVPMVGVIALCLGGLAAWLLAERLTLSVWMIFVFGYVATIAGSLLFAAVTSRTNIPLRPAAAVLAAGACLLLVGGMELYLREPWAGRGLAMFAGCFLFPLGWIAVGLSAVRLDRRMALAAG